MEQRGWLPDDLYELVSPGDPQLSPDGRWLAFVWQRLDRTLQETQSQIWLVPSDGSSEPKRLTAGPRDQHPRWSPDGSHLAFTARRNGKAQIWIIPTDGGEAWPLPTRQSVQGAACWAPDGSLLAFTARVFDKPDDWQPYAGAPDDDRARAARAAADAEGGAGVKADKRSGIKVITRLRHRFDGVGDFGDRRLHVFVAPFASAAEAAAAGYGERVRQVTTGDYDHDQPTWHPDGKRLAVVANRSARADWEQKSDVWLFGLEGEAPQHLVASPGALSAPRFAPDGEALAVIGSDDSHGGSTTSALWLLDLTANDPRGTLRLTEGRKLTAALDRPVGTAVPSDVRYGLPSVPPIWTGPDRLLFLAADRGRSYVYEVVTEGQAEPVMVTPAAEGAVSAFSWANGTLAWQWGCFTRPDSLFAQGADGKAREVVHFNRELLARTVSATAEPFTYAGANGLPIDGWLVRPVGAAAEQAFPLVLSIHGGPHGLYGDAFNLLLQVLAGQGMGCLFTNPRGSQSYGQAFASAVVEDWGGDDYIDLMRGVDEAVKRGADPDRLGVTGWSYGGYMTCWIVSQTTRFRAAVAGAVVSNRQSFYGTSDIGWHFGEHQFGGNAWEAGAHHLERSALSFAAQVETPVLFLHGESDLRCPISQSEEFFTALRRQGKTAVLVRYPGEFHGLTQPAHRFDRYQRTAAWFTHWLA